MKKAMPYEEALNRCILGRKIDGKNYYLICDEWFDAVDRALKKQIPKKHKTVDNILYCPSCESYHGRYGDIRIPVGSKYCPYCGQALDWSEVEE